MNVLDRLEKLAEKATERPWVSEWAPDSYSDIRSQPNYSGKPVLSSDEGNREEDFALIVAAVNVLPDLLRMARAASRVRVEEAAIGGVVVVGLADLQAALEPLLREAQP